LTGLNQFYNCFPRPPRRLWANRTDRIRFQTKALGVSQAPRALKRKTVSAPGRSNPRGTLKKFPGGHKIPLELFYIYRQTSQQT